MWQEARELKKIVNNKGDETQHYLSVVFSTSEKITEFPDNH